MPETADGVTGTGVVKAGGRSSQNTMWKASTYVWDGRGTFGTALCQETQNQKRNAKSLQERVEEPASTILLKILSCVVSRALLDYSRRFRGDVCNA